MPLPVTREGRLQLPAVGAPLCIVCGPEPVIAKCKVGVVRGLR